MKKVFIIITSFVLAFIILATNSVSVNAKNSYLQMNFLELNRKQAVLLSEAEKIVADDSYPSYFGGIYISDDSTGVVIQIVEENLPLSENSEGHSSYQRIISLEGDIVFEFVRYSYKELNAINNRIIEYYSSENAIQGNFSGNYVDVFNNVVIITLLDKSSDNVDKYRNRVLDENILKGMEYNSDIIQFTQGTRHDYAIKVGEEISVTVGSCSMGFRAKFFGNKGYITAGHCFTGLEEDATGGESALRAYEGSVDATWVQTTFLTNLFNPPSNDLEYASGSFTELGDNGEYCPLLGLNVAVAKSGFASEYTSGQVKSMNYSSYYGEYPNQVYFTGLIATDMEATFGDSGGGVFMPYDEEYAYWAGIIKGDSAWEAAFVSINEIWELWPEMEIY